ncbi:Hypothetical Protein PD5205_00740 [Xanthomonas fragariae]|uniref:Uncharacterized protein n=1 Tax=Xanthomonas fragariae TaxID=48664 RepID=A0A1Y6HIF6_9XANT|nr:hypothetical protein BER92_03555 [Xanthomonas fragariae]AOD17353.1 hypothetical protein BER93_03555 [Xanthomonas fragariae]ENZ94159.1 hypothetical protein O1K_17243 [Xanthomonas fragariae LMG 25863]SMR02060.1 Hypothetical Protein PD5205_00740 [Xanthomonas fragariae]
MTSRTKLAAKLKTRTRLGDQGDNATRKPISMPGTSAEEACYAQVRSLPLGAWFEFASNQQAICPGNGCPGIARRQATHCS